MSSSATRSTSTTFSLVAARGGVARGAGEPDRADWRRFRWSPARIEALRALLRAGEPFREAVETRILPALRNFGPDLVLISAGFDAHEADPLANLRLVEADFMWVTERLSEVASRHCNGRIVSMLEGGYDLTALARSVGVHVRTLMDAA